MPHHIAVNRDNLEPEQDPPGFIETEDYVELDGALRCKRHGSVSPVVQSSQRSGWSTKKMLDVRHVQEESTTHSLLAEPRHVCRFSKIGKAT